MKVTLKIEGKIRPATVITGASAVTTGLASAAGAYTATGASGAISLAALTVGGHLLAYRAGSRAQGA
ncbi:hypothetical protein [Actinomadura oligospora]|uniref:hypothetical protein n=1 Tax=Actinomadura oligospora TaxID=111804 RepID=UPI00047B08D9|nr:hypothetical protein [Actinomadura oligospora]